MGKKALLLILSGNLLGFVSPEAIKNIAETNECIERDFEYELNNLNEIAPWIRNLATAERMAIDIVTVGHDSKNWYDLIRTDCGAYGMFHFQPNYDYWGVGIVSDSECAYYDDHVWRYKVENLLYSDYSIPLQVEAWRSIVEPVASLYAGRAISIRDYSLMLAIANSSPYEAVRMSQECGYSVGCVALHYACKGRQQCEALSERPECLDAPSVCISELDDIPSRHRLRRISLGGR